MRPLAFLSLLLMLLLSACGTGAAAVGGAASSTGDAVSLDFTAETVAGKPVAGSELSGKPTVFWFWAPWCPTCRSQIPIVGGLAQKHADAVNFVGVGSLDSADALDAFAAKVPSEVTELADPDGAVWRHFGVTAQSTYLVVDADGKQVAKGSLDEAELTDLVDKLAG